MTIDIDPVIGQLDWSTSWIAWVRVNDPLLRGLREAQAIALAVIVLAPRLPIS